MLIEHWDQPEWDRAELPPSTANDEWGFNKPSKLSITNTSTKNVRILLTKTAPSKGPKYWKGEYAHIPDSGQYWDNVWKQIHRLEATPKVQYFYGE